MNTINNDVVDGGCLCCRQLRGLRQHHELRLLRTVEQRAGSQQPSVRPDPGQEHPGPRLTQPGELHFLGYQLDKPWALSRQNCYRPTASNYKGQMTIVHKCIAVTCRTHPCTTGTPWAARWTNWCWVSPPTPGPSSCPAQRRTNRETPTGAQPARRGPTQPPLAFWPTTRCASCWTAAAGRGCG